MEQPWQARIAAQVGRRVAALRERAPGGRLTAQAVADRCADAGLPLSRPVIAKLEKGLRDTLTLAELMVLAKALGVPPLLLAFPLGTGEDCEPLPGVKADPWAAMRWFTGQSGDPADPSSRPPQGISGALELWAEHARLESALAVHTGFAPERPGAPRYAAGAWAARLAGLTDELKAVRADIRSLGLMPPEPGPAAAAVLHAEGDGDGQH